MKREGKREQEKGNKKKWQKKTTKRKGEDGTRK